MFVEWNEDNVKQLKKEVAALGELPANVAYKIYNQNAFDLLTNLAGHLERTRSKLAPCFIFVDPYGFKVPCAVLRKIKAYSSSELLITLIWRELDMAMQQKSPQPGLTAMIDSVFGGGEWKDIRSIDDFDARAEAAVQLLKSKIGATWATYVRMLGHNNKTRYFLLHLTDHKMGRDLMKEVVWKCCPDNGYYVRKSDNPKQQYLIKPEPDLRSLKNWVIDKLSHKSYTWNDLAETLREEIWLNKHLWQVMRELKTSNQVDAMSFTGKFSQKANPTFGLKQS